MKELFHISNSFFKSPDKKLVLQVGERHIGFCITDPGGKEFSQLVYCISENSMDIIEEDQLKEILERYKIFEQEFKKINIGWDGPQLITNSSITKISFPFKIYEQLKTGFQHANYLEQASIQLKKNEKDADQLICADFRKDDFTVILFGHKSFLFTSNYEYSTPADVLYYLLRICEQFSFNQEKVLLRITGLVDRQSSLFRELYQYFTHIEFRDALWKQDTGYPAHFFTSLNDLATCE